MSSDRKQLAALGAVPLTNDYTLIKVPKRHARRAELAVVLAELAANVCHTLAEDEVLAWHRDDTEWELVAYDPHACYSESVMVFVREGGTDDESLIAPEVYAEADPLEAARLALARVRESV